MFNFHRQDLNYETMEENDFSVNFARFINEKNVIRIMNELSDAQRDIEQNVNPRMVFFDLSLKMIVLLINKN
jgi:DNA polymerase-3 subunit delta'